MKIAYDIPTRKILGSTKYPSEKKFGPTKSHEGTKARWHKTYDGTTHAKFSALFQERLILFMYYYM